MARRCFVVSELKFEFACTSEKSKHTRLVNYYLNKYILPKDYKVSSNVINGYDVDTYVNIKFQKEIPMNTIMEMLSCMFARDTRLLQINYNLEKNCVNVSVLGCPRKK